MKIPLSDFQKHIDGTILKRGLAYFKDGNIIELEEINEGQYEAVVEAPKDYTVSVSLQNGTITEQFCDCPYDMGPVCKHAVAVFYRLREDAEEAVGIKKTTGKKEAAKKTSKPKTAAQQIHELLEQIPHNKLKQFVMEQSSKNREFRSLLFASFAAQNTQESKEFYADQVKAIVNAATNRQGYIDWDGSKRISKAMDNMLSAAQRQIDDENHKSAFWICTAIIEGLYTVRDKAEGDIETSLNDALKMLSDITKEKLAENIRSIIFAYCLDIFDSSLYTETFMSREMIGIASVLTKTETEMQQVLNRIESALAKSHWKEYFQKLKHDMLVRLKGEKAGEKFMEENITNETFRETLIQQAMGNKNYAKAASLAQGGVTQDTAARYPGLVRKWQEWLFKIAQAADDKDKTIQYARLLYIDNRNLGLEYYPILKKTVKTSDWNNFIQGVALEIIKKHWHDTAKIADLYIKEEWWDKLLELIKNTRELYWLEKYDKYFPAKYAADIIALYETGIVEYMQKHVSREHYVHACRYIKNMMRLGAKAQANKIVAYFRAEYPRRKALIEELQSFG